MVNTKATVAMYPEHCLTDFSGFEIFLKNKPTGKKLHPRLAYRVGSQSIIQPWRVVSVTVDTVTSYKVGTLLKAARALKTNQSKEGFIFYGQGRELYCQEPVPQGKIVERVCIYLEPSRADTEVIEYYEMYKDISGRLWTRKSSLVDPKFWHWGALGEDKTQTHKTLTKAALLGS